MDTNNNNQQPAEIATTSSVSEKHTKSGSYAKVEGVKEVPEGYQFISEGTASILFSKNNEVFYNKVQVFNRDLSIMAIKVFDEIRRSEKSKKGHEDLKILEALSATGLRSIRYWNEIPGIQRIIANDISADAVEAIRKNVEFNEISTEKVVPNHADASTYMYMNRDPKNHFHVVDLDPYGSASIFLDGAIQCVEDGGLLCVTCTDMGVLAGNHPETCYAKYASMPVKGRYCKEMALRIVLASIQQHASKYKRYIVPLLSLSIDFYIRIFVRVYVSPNEVKNSISKLGYVYQCIGCDTFHTQPLGRVIEKEVQKKDRRRDKKGSNEQQAGEQQEEKDTPMADAGATVTEQSTREGGEKKNISIRYVPGMATALPGRECAECGSHFQMGGPFWMEPIHDLDFVQRCMTHMKQNEHLYSTNKRIQATLNLVSKELPDVPLFYALPSLCNTLHCPTPQIAAYRSAIINAGYKVSRSHCDPDAIKTTAPPTVLWDILRCWVKENPVRNISDKSPAKAILAKEPSLKADFTKVSEGIQNDPFFFPNPEENWGPKARAKSTSYHKRNADQIAQASNSNGKASSPSAAADASQTKKPKADTEQ